MGRHVNELRRNTTNESLAKRAKELVKKWRSMVLPESNGQIEETKGKKRTAKEILENVNIKRTRLNGQTSEFEFSDNSNSSFKDVINVNVNTDARRDVILINSDSNSSFPEKLDPLLEQQLPKKRGRKKGSKNHRNLLDEAETSFTNKMAVSRGNAKVKTTQELIASLQNKNSNSLNIPTLTNKPIEDLNERAAKLTERVSIIDQKLNTNASRYKNAQRKNSLKLTDKKDKIQDFTNQNSIKTDPDDEIIIVDDLDKPEVKTEETEVKPEEKVEVVASLSYEEAMSKLPPIDASVLEESETDPPCTCQMVETKTDFSVEEDFVDVGPKFEFVEDCRCAAKSFLADKYRLGAVTDDRVYHLHENFIPNVNGNFSVGGCKSGPEILENGCYVNVVPNVNMERIPKNHKVDFTSENYKKYSISDNKDESTFSNTSDVNSEQTFREWHELVDTPSYNGENLKILPYVIID